MLLRLQSLSQKHCTCLITHRLVVHCSAHIKPSPQTDLPAPPAGCLAFSRSNKKCSVFPAACSGCAPGPPPRIPPNKTVSRSDVCLIWAQNSAMRSCLAQWGKKGWVCATAHHPHSKCYHSHFKSRISLKNAQKKKHGGGVDRPHGEAWVKETICLLRWTQMDFFPVTTLKHRYKLQ